MKKYILLIVTFSGIMAWQSCQYEWVDPIETVTPDIVSFSGDIQPIFDRSCNGTGCHAAGGEPPDLSTSDIAYMDLFARNQIDTVNPEQSTLYTKCAPGGSMNKYTKTGDTEFILKWIQQGALKN